ncbi:MAG: BrnT family toxin [Chloroflexales bacterium]|nr:BrnT family toxin [Chloroflexales bacterium]
MRFEWDEDKNETNIRLHGIDFADVPTVFNGPMLTDLDDRIDYGEDRWIGIGVLTTLTVVIIWTERDIDTIRLISARKANRYERQRYEAYLTNRLGPFS